MSFDPQPAARHLLQLRQQRKPVGVLPAAPATEAEGAAVQRAMAEAVGAMPPAGFKIGATGRRMQSYLGIETPIAGFMRRQDVHAAPAQRRFADFTRPGVECEVVVRLAHDLPAGPCTLEQALAAVCDLVAGIEVVENRYGDPQAVGVPTLVADGMYHAAAVIGAGADWRSLPIEALRGRISLDNGFSDEGLTTDLLGHPLNGLAWLAASPLAAAFGGLRAGQLVMLGSVTPPVWLEGPADVTVTFPPLPPVVLRVV
jgi:2-keto-4-pentenoate hydratase